MTDRTFPRVNVLGALRVIDPDGNERVPLGQAERTLLTLLALNGRCVHVEQAMDALWPELSLAEGRDRLRKLLYRLPAQCGRLVFREGQTLVLRAHTDLADYEWALAILITHCAEQLAPEARYAEWAEPARRRLHVTAGQLAALV